MMNNVKSGKDAYVAPPVKEITYVSSGGGSSGSTVGWTPPPPPSSPPVLEDEEERLRMAHARNSTNV